jgi:hypothetical protein
VLTSLGDSYLTVDDRDAARTAWQQALDIFERLGLPDADDTRARLTKLNEKGDQ